jgi:hypothetical protein
VLAVGDDELAVRDDDDALSEVAEGGHVQEDSGNSCGQTSGNPAGRFQASRQCWGPRGTVSVNIFRNYGF